ncbi:phosphate/phosphite/phosphonate ABC transporter substrate-binding protein [Natronococcus pandeyae]|uniref:Phosphate/phosphite/phosphonate ABC transporter substrate-binding protein n=1 Tax=Natronococcus pandeyae TaxID=2055836 RepID=A0A8J8PYI3_9EURY|nr:substrate-binding domain-containing protein [Natronococcus pandeyae]TYL36151.1 phosphate/phosphite/phosphonate ABC transporter substrate-binding protein [Natronococcus pandeyae]
MTQDSNSEDSSRRRFLVGAGVVGATALAGCTGDDESDGSSDVSEDDFPDFDPTNPEYPQLGSTLIEHDFELGTTEFLEEMETQDEPRYGNAPPEPPEDESEWIDPDTLVFSYGAGETGQQAYEGTLDPIVENIEEETGKDVQFEILNSYAAQVEAMNAERLHIAAFFPGNTPHGVNLAEAIPLAMPVGEDGTFGYKLWVITQADNDEINSVEDLAGKDVAHTSETSGSGNQAPRAMFEQDFGVVPDEDYEVTYSGGHEQSILAVDNGDYEAGPVASTNFREVAEAGQIDAADIKVVWSSNPFPSGPFSIRYNLAPDIREGIEAAFFDYDYTGTEMAEEIHGGTFTEVDYATHWDVILTSHEHLGIDYGDDIEDE